VIAPYISWALIALGVAIVVRTLVAGGGVAAVGLLLGALFVAAGGLRLWLTRASRNG
jgi:hypothetical protein